MKAGDNAVYKMAYGGGTGTDTTQSGSLYRVERGIPFMRRGVPVVATPQFKALNIYSPTAATAQIPSQVQQGIAKSGLASGGSGYAANDTGLVLSGNGNAAYKVITVSAGVVATYTITSIGSGYSIANGVGTAKSGSQPGSGVGFTINIAALTGSQQSTTISIPGAQK